MVVNDFVSDRIEAIMRHFGKNKNSFSSDIGLTNNVTIGRIVNENRNPSFEVLQKIAIAYPEVNFNWLLTGEGSMLKNDNSEAVLTPVNYLKVPLVPVRAQAGLLQGYGDTAYWDGLPTELWEVDKEYKGHYVVFEVKGDSMFDNSVNAILDGDRILCREIDRSHWQNKLHINKWNFVIVHKNEGVIVKRITHHEPENGNIICHSLNPLFDDLHLNLKDVVALYNVVDLKRTLRL